MSEKIQCPCCGYYTIEDDGTEIIVDICDVCYWQYDWVAHKYPNNSIGPNRVALEQARINFKEFGACREDAKLHTRLPLAEELTMDLIQEYYITAKETSSFDSHGDEQAVADMNKKAARLREIATLIESDYPELKERFCKLLHNENPKIRLWVAHHILEGMNCERAYRKNALKEISHEATTNKSVNGLGNRIWLKEWYKTHPKDRWLRWF